MTFHYRLARTARQNLEEISDYWTSTAGPDIALETLRGIMETIITLSGQPRAGVLAERFGKGVRKFPTGTTSSIIVRTVQPESRSFTCFT
jgi:plasmid stabilization system protein ParE